MNKPLTLYLLKLCAVCVASLALLRPAAIPEFVVMLVLVCPGYYLLERGRMVLGFVVLFVGLVAAALVTKIGGI